MFYFSYQSNNYSTKNKNRLLLLLLLLKFRKHEANDVKCSELGWLCIPLVVESYGAWGKEAMEVIFESSLSPSHNIIKTQVCRSIRAVWPAQSEPCKG